MNDEKEQREKRIQEYEEMNEELYKIQKAIRMVWGRDQQKLVDEFIKEGLK
jgi:diphthamide synthase (EF-2-diphthine--ammonia ligase)